MFVNTFLNSLLYLSYFDVFYFVILLIPRRKKIKVFSPVFGLKTEKGTVKMFKSIWEVLIVAFDRKIVDFLQE